MAIKITGMRSCRSVHGLYVLVQKHCQWLPTSFRRMPSSTSAAYLQAAAESAIAVMGFSPNIAYAI